MDTLIGQPAPTFSIPDSNGETYDFGSYNAPTVLFFFPKAGSWGCTKEACQLQTLSENENFKRANTRIVGVSADSVEKQKAFVEKAKLTYPILSDESGDARKAYGIKKHFFGSATRTTFVIDKAGTVRAVLDATLNYNAHAKFANKEVDKLEAEEKKDVAPAKDESAGEVVPSPDAAVATEADQSEPAATAA